MHHPQLQIIPPISLGPQDIWNTVHSGQIGSYWTKKGTTKWTTTPKMGNLPKVCLRRLWTYCKHRLIPTRAHSSKKQHLWFFANVNIALPSLLASSQPQTRFSLKKTKCTQKGGAWVWKQTHGSPQTQVFFLPLHGDLNSPTLKNLTYPKPQPTKKTRPKCAS